MFGTSAFPGTRTTWMKVGPRPRFSCPRPEPCTSSGSRRLGREVPCPPPVDWFPVPPNAPLSRQTNVRFSVASAVPSRQEDDDPKAPSSREQSPVFKHRVVMVVDERYRFSGAEHQPHRDRVFPADKRGLLESPSRDLNSGPADYKSAALPAKPLGHTLMVRGLR